MRSATNQAYAPLSPLFALSPSFGCPQRPPTPADRPCSLILWMFMLLRFSGHTLTVTAAALLDVASSDEPSMNRNLTFPHLPALRSSCLATKAPCVLSVIRHSPSLLFGRALSIVFRCQKTFFRKRTGKKQAPSDFESEREVHEGRPGEDGEVPWHPTRAPQGPPRNVRDARRPKVP